MTLDKFILSIYRSTSTKQGFMKKIRLSSSFSNCEDDVLGAIWDLIELVPIRAIEEMFRDHLDSE